MIEFIYKLTLDLNCSKTPPVICSGQFDKGRKFEFTVTANGEPYDATGCSAVLKGVRNDGSHFAVGCTVSDGKIIKILDDTTLSVRGKTVAKLVISDSEKSYSTQIFIIDVDSALDGDITVFDDYSILNRLIEQIHALNESGAIIVDDTINSDSNNAVSNKAVATALAGKLNNTDGIKFVTTNSINDCTDDKTLYRVYISDGSVLVGYHNLICINQSNCRSQYVFAQNGKMQYRTARKDSNGEWGEWSKWLAVVNDSDLSNGLAAKADKNTTYNKSEIDIELAKKADKSDTYTKSEIDAELAKKINEEDVYTAEEADDHFQRILTAGDNIKIDDNKQGKITISADLSKKYDAANVESGSGDLSLYSENTPVTSAKFNYQRIGDFVMVTLNIVFSAASMAASKPYMLLGLPYRNEVIFRKPVITTTKNKLTVAIVANTATLTIITQGEAVAISDGESIQETLIYKIKK